ncbi:MAG: TonB C-terminal domain-containing protein [Alphaproteobacteria bacterium]
MVFSAFLHIFVALLVFLGVPSLFMSDEVIDQPIPVEIYTVADETTLPRAAPEPEPEAEPEPAQEPEPPAPKEVEIPPPPESVPQVVTPPKPVPVKEPEKPPPPKPAEPEPAKIAPPPPPKPVQVAKVEPKPAPVEKPKPKPEPEPQQNFSTLLKDLAAKPKQSPEPAEPKQDAKPKPAETPRKSTVTSVRNEPLSLSVIDAIRRQVEDKWNVPIGARDVADLEVEIRILLQPDGTVTAAQIVDQQRLRQSGEEFFRSMAESARRAVWRASPLQNLPPEKYNQWREITFTFKPPA